MCGILGVYGNTRGSQDVKNGVCLQLLSHRGPDDSGIYVNKDDAVFLGHTRLAIIDLDVSANQPMISSDDRVIIVFNGEIYNYRKLRSELINEGYLFKTESDTEVLLNLYLSSGKDMLYRLDGIFSFAIWDNTRKELFVARDHFGVKPLYYHHGDDLFAFSSEIKSLLCLFDKKKSPDIESINRYLTFLWCPGKGSPLKGIYKVLPGEAIFVRKGKVLRKLQWYKYSEVKSLNYTDFSNQNDKDLAKMVAISLQQAVHKQMVADVQVGAFLSGGLDSSAVVTFAREVNTDIQCFTIDSLGKESGTKDDLPYAQKVAKHLGVALNVISVDSSSMASGLENMVAMLDEPIADPAALNVFYISQLARDQGVKVLLSGAGGDDIFTGYRRHYALQLDKWLQRVPLKVRSIIENLSTVPRVNNYFFRRLAKLFNGSSLEGDSRIINYFRWADQDLVYSLFRDEVKYELKDLDGSMPVFEFLKKLPDGLSPLDRMLALEQRFFLSDHNLLYTDKMSMAAGVEVRVPFLDLNLVNFAAHIPIRYKQRGSVGKWILKKAMEPYLPHDVIYRPKTGFGVPLRTWLRVELKEFLLDLLSVESINNRGVFDPVAVHRLIENNETGVIDASYTILSLMCIEIWCRHFLDGEFDYKRVYGGS